MGFSSFDDIISELTAATPKGLYRTYLKISLNATGVAGTWYSAWQWAGYPGAGDVSGTAKAAVQCNDGTTGALTHGGNVSTDTKHLLRVGAQAFAATAVPGFMMLVDRLLYYPGIDATSNANQGLTNGVTLPRYTSGEGVRAFLEVTTAITTTTGVFTFGDSGYTNTTPTGGRQHGVTVNTASSSAVARIPHSSQTASAFWNPFLPMQAGDTGVKSVESVKFTTAHGAGVVCLVLCYPLITLPIPGATGNFSERDALYQFSSLPRIYDGACLQWLVFEPGALVANTPYFLDANYVYG